ncbi:MAG: transglycosylase SLT domain-containing protein [Candidatus Obscuribacterales bacterium]|nr:transglycosylase SLT domain-containing protein [Candidatus Obscuribacterales bacterium]
MMTPNSYSRTHNNPVRAVASALAAATVSLLGLSSCSSNGPVDVSGAGKLAPITVGTVQDAPLLALLKQIERLPLERKKEHLLAYRAGAISGRAKQKSAYVLARLYRKSGTTEDTKLALPLFEEAAGLPALAARASFHAADCANFLGNQKQARLALEQVIKNSTVPLERASAHYALAQSCFRAGDQNSANFHWLETIKEAPDSQVAIGSKYYLGQNNLRAGHLNEALKLWREYLTACPDGRFGPQIATVLGALNPITTADQLLLAQVYYYHAAPDKALMAWNKAGDRTQWIKQAQCLYRLGKSSLAREALYNGIKTHPTDPDVVEAAKMLCKPICKEDATRVWQYVLVHCPAAADAALYNIAMRATGTAALESYSELVRKFPDSDYAPESSWWLLWNKIMKGNNAAALADATAGAQRYAKARAGARFHFWTGKLHERMKQQDAARAAYQRTADLYPKDYYGWRASARLEALAGGTDRGWSTNVADHVRIYSTKGSNWDWPEPPLLVSFDEIESTCGPAVSMLAQLRQWDECLELTAKETYPVLRSICLAKLGRPLEAINTMSGDLSGRPGETAAWQLSYPLLYGRIMSGEGALKKVDPLLAQALTREESRYNVDAVSLSNARGLMQLLPPTAYGVAKKLGVGIGGMRDMHRPEINLKLGIDYLSYTLSRFHGNAMLAVASYNGGPNAVASFTKKYSLVDQDSFIEQIPYTETRDYVRKVFGSYWNYEGIYGAKRARATISSKEHPQLATTGQLRP